MRIFSGIFGALVMSLLMGALALPAHAGPFDDLIDDVIEGGSSAVGDVVLAPTWSAVIMTDDHYSILASSEPTEQAAIQAAKAHCGGRPGCNVYWTTQANCVSVVSTDESVPIGAGFWYAAGGGDTAEIAQGNAMRICQGPGTVGTCQHRSTSCAN